MENSENDMYITDLIILSNNYLQLRESQWKNMGSQETANQKQKYKNELNFALEKSDSPLFSSEKGCLLAKYAVNFGSDILDKEKLDNLNDKLEKKYDEYPILSEIDKKIAEFRKQMFNFFVSTGDNFVTKELTFSISKTGNQNADVLINTEINRAIIDQNTRNHGKGKDGTYSSSLTDSNNTFVLNLSK